MLVLMQSIVPDIWTGEDGNTYIMFQVESSQIESVFLANQVLLEDMYVQTANYAALARWGDMFGVPQKPGTVATGQLLFSATGGTFIDVGSEVYYEPGGGFDPLFFVTTESGTVPNPGIPVAVTIADSGVAGNLTGTYEYVVTFLTNQGETTAGGDSNAVTVASKKINVSAIPIGGPSTLSRNIYRSLNAGDYLLVGNIPDNVATTYVDNLANGSEGTQQPPEESTAERIQLAATAETTGLLYNAVPGQITVLNDVPSGVTAVTNPVAFTGGTDQEEYEVYRARLLGFIRSPFTGSSADLTTWALEIDGVDSASVFPNDANGVTTPGHVTVRIAGPNGTQVSDDLIALVLTTLQDKDLANITIHVGNFTPVQVNVSVTVTPAGTYTTSDISPSVTTAIQDYINSVPVGGTLTVSGIIAAIMDVPGVFDVNVDTPTSARVAAASEKFVPGSIVIS